MTSAPRQQRVVVILVGKSQDPLAARARSLLEAL